MKEQQEVKWYQAPNFSDTAMLAQHAYIKVIKKDWYGEEYESNKALCSKTFISEDGETGMPWSKLESEKFRENMACKKCIKILNKPLSKR